MAQAVEPSGMTAFVVALLGAESTGKSQLSQGLHQALLNKGYKAVLVPEYLRTWCDQAGRTPTQSEQAMIANQQTKRIKDAAHAADIVIADTTALMTAVYSDYLFNDQSLYEMALRAQSACSLALVMGLDLPWVADGLQRDGAHVREPVDALLRTALCTADIAFQTVYGLGDVRPDAALAMVMQSLLAKPKTKSTWKHFCECCGDGECERRLFSL